MAICNTVYLVVQAKGGWAVNNGKDTLSLHPTHDDAAARARELSDEAADEGEAASVVDIDCGGVGRNSH